MKQVLSSLAAIAAVVASAKAQDVGPFFGPLWNPDNGHYYEVGLMVRVPEDDRSFDLALETAASRSFQEQTGYLATVTSAAEHEFLVRTFGTFGTLYIGASDAAVEGEWRWVSGPEAGELFWLGDGDGSAVTYAAWTEGEPNDFEWDATGEDFAVINWRATIGLWNDISAIRTGLARGFIVEYAPVPELSSIALAGAAAVALAFFSRRRSASPSPST